MVDLTESLLKAISIIADKSAEEVSSDKTIKAIIKKVISTSDDKYLVTYNNGDFYAYIQSGSQEVYQVGEQIYVLVPKGEKKTDYVKDIKHSILVDDYYVNLMTWMEEGGLAIKKTFSGKQRPIPQVMNLVEIFKVLYDLKLMNN